MGSGFVAWPRLPVSLDVVLPLANTNGTAPWSLALPPNPGLIGRTFYLQGLVVDPPTNGLGLALIGAGTASIGRP